MTEAATLLEDEDVQVKLPRNGFVAGHVIIRPTSDTTILEEVPTEILTKMFTLANRLGGILFEALECDGTNLLIQNGVAAGQVDDVTILHVIPRWEEDGLDFSWASSQVGEHELGQVQDRLDFVDEQTASEPAEPVEEEPSDRDGDGADVISGDENYYVKQMRRGPP